MYSQRQSKPRVAVAQIGARRHYAIPTILHRAGMLERFYTDISARAKWLQMIDQLAPRKLMPGGIQRLLARKITDLPQDRIVHFNQFGLRRIMRRDRNTLAAKLRANRQFCTLVNQHSLEEADAVYAFNGAALEILQNATHRGLFRILEQTAAPVAIEHQTSEQERLRWPGWQTAAAEDWQPTARRERAEWELADLILCGSQSVVAGIQADGGPVERCAVVPYGIDIRRFDGQLRATHNRPLRLLAVGNVRINKGFQYLIPAAEHLRQLGISIRIVGEILVGRIAQEQLRQMVELTGPVPRDQVNQHYRWADVFVLPSLSEGSANVCYEALASGLPVITTEAAGSVVQDGIEGFIVPCRSSRAIVEAVRRLNSDRALLAEMSRAALTRAKEFTWAHYADRLLAVLSDAFARRTPARHDFAVGYRKTA